MGQHLLKSYGVICILFGSALICSFPLVSYSLGEASLLTELALGLVLVWFGARLIVIARKQDEKYPEDEEEDNYPELEDYENVYGTVVVDGSLDSAPFYYELEEPQRALPPIPKDIGREYDPVVVDKV